VFIILSTSIPLGTTAYEFKISASIDYVTSEIMPLML
jgi:hypothetical protein